MAISFFGVKGMKMRLRTRRADRVWFLGHGGFVSVRVDPMRDARALAELEPLQTAWQREYAARAKLGTLSPEIEQFRWLLEELRVSLFAQELRTPVPVSTKRLAKLWQSIRSS